MAPMLHKWTALQEGGSCMKVEDIKTAGVIGAGTMGAGVAGELARAGIEVRLADVDQQRLDHGLEMAANAQQGLIDAGRLSVRKARQAANRISATTSLEAACDGVLLVIEAVSEDLQLKRKLFRRFDQCCPKRAILASNTSGLSITKIGAAVKKPTRVAGLHFWNPPHIIPLVEVTKGKSTSTATARTLMDLCEKLGKRPILVRHDIPGFVGNRLQFAVLREALHLLNEGVASAEDIDAAMTAGPGLRWAFMGPLRTADLGGLDVFHAISQYMFAQLSDEREPTGVLPELVERGHQGAKTGRGFYRYAGGDLGEAVGQRDRVLMKFLEVLEEEARG